jgi:hypothetical protein
MCEIAKYVQQRRTMCEIAMHIRDELLLEYVPP